MIHVPIWFHLLAVGVQAFGYWKAGDGWRYGWVLAALSHSLWVGFAVATDQPLVALGGLTYAFVAYRNSRKEQRASGTEASLESG